MVNGTIRGKVVSRWKLPNNKHGLVFALRIRFEQYVHGDKQPVLVDVWFAERFSAREKFIFNENVSYFTITFDKLGAAPKSNGDEPAAVCAVFATDIYL